MDKQLDFYQVDAEYITYLHGIDSRVPNVDYSAERRHDKFLCGIVLSVGGHGYFAPISSFCKPQRTNIVIKDANGKDVSSIRFSFMIPVPPGVVSVKRIADEPSMQYRTFLNMELQYCRRNANAIFSRARFVYNAVAVKKDPLMVKNCCDFKALEAACAEYSKEQTRGQIKVADNPVERPSTLKMIREARKAQRESPPGKSDKTKRKDGHER